MSDVKEFEVLGKIIEIKDAYARNELNNKADKLSEIVWLGDSFSTGWQSPGTYLAHSIPSIVSAKLGLNIHNYGVDDAGYVHTGVNNSTFYQQAVTSVNDDTLDRESVKYVCILGGVNDFNDVNVNATQIEYASISLINYLMSNYSNATIIEIPNWCAFNFDYSTIDKLLAAGHIDIGNYNRRYMFLKQNLLSLVGRTEYINADNLHPNQNGAAYMAECIYYLINGVTPPVNEIISVVSGSAFDCHLRICEDFYGYTIEGYARALETITGVNNNICLIQNPHFTYFEPKYLLNSSKTGKANCTLQIAGAIPLNPTYTQGYINMYWDNGNTIVAGDDIPMYIRINKCELITG